MPGMRGWLLVLGLLLAVGCGSPVSERPDRQADVASQGNAVVCETPSRRMLTATPPTEISATFSIVAIDPEAGICGAAVASKFPAVGNVVPYVRGGVGAFCTQHYHHPEFGPRALELLEQDKDPNEILAELLRDDSHAATRQLAIIDRRGQTAQHNPVDAPESSRWWGAMSGRYYACQGNTLAGREVIEAMSKAYETQTGSLADRLLAALVAGDSAGGDHRGRLAAGIVVAKPGSDRWLDLHVDASDDAVTELARKYEQLEHDAKGDVHESATENQ